MPNAGALGDDAGGAPQGDDILPKADVLPKAGVLLWPKAGCEGVWACFGVDDPKGAELVLKALGACCCGAGI